MTKNTDKYCGEAGGYAWYFLDPATGKVQLSNWGSIRDGVSAEFDIPRVTSQGRLFQRLDFFLYGPDYESRVVGSYHAPSVAQVHLQNYWGCRDRAGSFTSRSEQGAPFDYVRGADIVIPAMTCADGSVLAQASSYLIYDFAGGSGAQLFNYSAPNWVNTIASYYPRCLTSGSKCTMDILAANPDGSTTSCFVSRACVDWTSVDPDGSNHICRFGPYTLPISNCYNYGNPGNAPGTPSRGLPGAPTAEEPALPDGYQGVWDAWSGRARVPDYGYTTSTDEAGDRDRAVRACLAVATVQDCKDKPVFFPGADVYEAAVHDQEAISGEQSAVLTYYPSKPDPLTLADGSTVSHSWYESEAVCKAGTVGDGLDCDEYPYWSTVEGGPGASLKLVKASDNRREGRLLSGFATRCGLTTTDDRQFITAPIVVAGDTENRPGSASMAYCAGQLIVPPAEEARD